MTRRDQLLPAVLLLAVICSFPAMAEEDAVDPELTSDSEPATTSRTPEVPAGSSDTIYMTETVISGNQELPRVLYIVPWRDTGVTEVPDSSTLLMPQLDNIQPLNPREFRRQLDIHESVAANADKEK